MSYNFCPECGEALVIKDHKTDGPTPYCPRCGRFRHPLYNTAVSMIVRRRSDGKILLILQYGKPGYILVAGYINRGESAEAAAARELKEETGLNALGVEFNRSRFFEPSNTLMCNFTVTVEDGAELKLNDEVDSAAWFTPARARENIRPNSLAGEFLREYLDGE